MSLAHLPLLPRDPQPFLPHGLFPAQPQGPSGICRREKILNEEPPSQVWLDRAPLCAGGDTQSSGQTPGSDTSPTLFLPSFLKKNLKKEPIFGKQSTKGGKRFQLKTLKFSMERLKKLKIAHVTLLMPPQGPGQALPAP